MISQAPIGPEWVLKNVALAAMSIVETGAPPEQTSSKRYRVNEGSVFALQRIPAKQPLVPGGTSPSALRKLATALGAHGVGVAETESLHSPNAVPFCVRTWNTIGPVKPVSWKLLTLPKNCPSPEGNAGLLANRK